MEYNNNERRDFIGLFNRVRNIIATIAIDVDSQFGTIKDKKTWDILTASLRAYNHGIEQYTANDMQSVIIYSNGRVVEKADRIAEYEARRATIYSRYIDGANTPRRGNPAHSKWNFDGNEVDTVALAIVISKTASDILDSSLPEGQSFERQVHAITLVLVDALGWCAPSILCDMLARNPHVACVVDHVEKEKRFYEAIKLKLGGCVL
jgi:hypothetical protein